MGKSKAPKKKQSGQQAGKPSAFQKSLIALKSFSQSTYFGSAVIVLLTAAIYSNTLRSSFQFDDFNVLDNLPGTSLISYLRFASSRDFGFLSFELNYRLGGMNILGYHLTNIAVHAVNGLLVYGIVLLLFRAMGAMAGKSRDPDQTRRVSLFVAFSVALLFVAHPIQTQAVTYIVQRFASLAATFYFLAMYGYLRWRLLPAEKKLRYGWYIGSLLAAFLAMRTKEIGFTVPATLLLIEVVFFYKKGQRKSSGSAKTSTAVLSGAAYVLPATLLFLFLAKPYFLPATGGEGSALALPRETALISRHDYLITQFRVLVTYLRLLVLPINQNVDYQYPVRTYFFKPEVFLSFLFLVGIAGFAVFLWWRADKSRYGQTFKLMSFGLLFFFLALSVESSFFPIKDVIFEHRLYLPSFGFFLAVASAASLLPQTLTQKEKGKPFDLRPLFIVLGVVVLALSFASYQRNKVWKSEITLWQDVVKKSPGKARARMNLGIAYKHTGKLADAIREEQIALDLMPQNADIDLELGFVYEKMGKLTDAISHYQAALKKKPDYAEAHYNLGNVYIKQEKPLLAVDEYKDAIRLDPDYAEAHFNLGSALANFEQYDEASREFAKALELRPDYYKASYSLAIIYRNKGNYAQAVSYLRKTLEIKPNYQPAKEALASMSK